MPACEGAGEEGSGGGGVNGDGPVTLLLLNLVVLLATWVAYEVFKLRREQDFVLAQLKQLTEEIHQMATSTGAGLAALDQSVLDLTAAVTTETSNVSTATTEIAAVLALLNSSEDTEVQAQAALIEAQVAKINAANGNLATAVASLPAPAPATTPAPASTPAAPTPGVIPAG